MARNWLDSTYRQLDVGGPFERRRDVYNYFETLIAAGGVGGGDIGDEVFRAGDTEASVLAAIAAAGANGGGKVEAAAKSYALTETWYVPSNVWLDFGGTTVVGQDTAANLDVMIATEGWEDLVGTMTVGGTVRSRISNVIIDGNYENNLTGTTLGLGIYGYGWDMLWTRIRHCRRLGLHTEWGTPVDPTNPPLSDREAATEGYVFGLRINDCIEGGWYFNGPNDPLFMLMFLVRNGHMGNPAMPISPGFNMKLGPNAVAPIFNMAHLWGNSFRHLEMTDAQGGEFHGFQIEGGGNTTGAGAAVYYNVPGALFVGGRIFTGPVGAGWLDSAKGIEIGPSGTGLQIVGTAFDYCRPAFDFTNGGGALSSIRAKWAANAGNMITGTPDSTCVFDIHDSTWDAGNINLPMSTKRVVYGYTDRKGGGRIVSKGTHTLDYDFIETNTELSGASPVVTLGVPTLATVPLGSKGKFIHKGTGTASFLADSGGSQAFGMTDTGIGTYDGPAIDGDVRGQLVTAPSPSGTLLTASCWLTVVNASTQNVRMMVYSNSGGNPNTLLATSATVAVNAASVGGVFSAAYVTFTFTAGPTLTAATQYHIVVQFGTTASTVRLGYVLTGAGAGWIGTTNWPFAGGAPAAVGAISSASGNFYLNASIAAPVSIRSKGGLLNLAQYGTAEVYRSAVAEYVLTGDLS